MQLTPSPELAGLVKHYLIIESQAVTGRNHRFFPDGHPGLVFSYADSIFQPTTNTQNGSPLDSFVYGQLDRYHNLRSGKNIGMLIVVLHPWGLHAISGIPGIETTNYLITLSDVFGYEGVQLQEQVVSEVTTISRINRIEHFLLKRWKNINHESVSIQTGIQLIHSTQGMVPIQALTRQLNMTERSLERRFDKFVGLSPKQYSRIARLQNCLKIHRSNHAMSLTELAYTAGYYDQAHFIREFTNLVGITPSQYNANTQRLAVNVMLLTTPPVL
ncbi:AraC family transcriptional regulator [Spirosoma agri]|uniref:AraC family transcriptional regulator n=1 Tax=Spirosoma agri TaxID=1987381 RepID=A0A6M0IND1_9BACT|nr:helix-turn-helix domain-containing protein [Spirosoma agri]NEU69442.1 AraC family transcriptional regulator [Spirosoma agri]